VDPRDGLDIFEKRKISLSAGIRTPDCPARSLVAVTVLQAGCIELVFQNFQRLLHLKWTDSNVMVMWDLRDVTHTGLVQVYRRFRDFRCFQHSGKRDLMTKALMMESGGSSEASGPLCHVTRRHIPEDSILPCYACSKDRKLTTEA
jgi:hypothetical protein